MLRERNQENLHEFRDAVSDKWSKEKDSEYHSSPDRLPQNSVWGFLLKPPKRCISVI